MTLRKKSQSKTRMQGKTSYRARYVELAHQGFRLRAPEPVDKWSKAGSCDGGKHRPGHRPVFGAVCRILYKLISVER